MNKENNFEEIQPVQSSTIPLPIAGKDMNSILKSLETGVENIFTGDKYAQYLQTMSKFHRYSFNNTLLIAMQRPDATLVTGYRNWQSMGRQVKKGEKGITILAPAPIKRKREQEILDQNHMPLLDADGNPRREEVEVVIPRFKPTTVFDISQTDGEPIETLAPEELTEAVADYDLFMKAITAVSPVPIRFDEIAGEAKGYYHSGDKEIVIQKGMSESQTIKTAIHETGHARLHDKDIMEEQGIEKDRLTKEVEAESVAYCVCSAFGVDTSEYSFPYIAGWSSGRDMKELKASMDIIRKTAGEMIDELVDNLQELLVEKKQLLESEQKEKLIPAMEAAGYHFDELESTDGNLRFLPDGTHEIGGVMISDSWNDVKEWLEGVVLEDPDTAERVERVMHPQRYEKSSEELMFAGEERYALYQLNTESKDVPYEFMGMDFVKDHGMEVTAADYKCVYSGILHDSVSLDELYSIFNQNHPADFKGHSMSVSDVVIVNRNGDMKAYYVDSFGFADLPDFVKQRQEALGIESPESHLDVGEKNSCMDILWPPVFTRDEDVITKSDNVFILPSFELIPHGNIDANGMDVKKVCSDVYELTFNQRVTICEKNIQCRIVKDEKTILDSTYEEPEIIHVDKYIVPDTYDFFIFDKNGCDRLVAGSKAYPYLSNCDVITERKEEILYTAIIKTRRNYNEKMDSLFIAFIISGRLHSIQ